MYSLNIDESDRILSATFERYMPDGVIVDHLPDGNITDYKYTDGRYIYDPLPRPIEPDPEPDPEPVKQYVTFDDLNKALNEGVNSI